MEQKINYFNLVNEKLFFFIFNNFNKYKFISKFFIFISTYSHYIFFISYGVGFIYSIINYKKLGLIFIFKYLFIPFSTLQINKLLRKIFKVKRPAQKLKTKTLILYSPNYGFPSNHSASSIVICFCIIALNIKLFYIFFTLAFLTGLSRVVTGVHYPFDVLAGFFVGYLFGSFI